MTARLALFSLTAALLYFGPFLAGLSDAPILLVLLFATIFLLWVAIMRPSIWAKTTGAGTPLALATYLGGLTIIQMMLVVFAFALGRGLAALLDGVISLPLWVPVLISMTALPLGALLRDPEAEAAEEQAVLDEIEKRARDWTQPPSDAPEKKDDTGAG